jgi:hypothetical protein
MSFWKRLWMRRTEVAEQPPALVCGSCGIAIEVSRVQAGTTKVFRIADDRIECALCHEVRAEEAPLPPLEPAPLSKSCPECGTALRTPKAQQCFHCGADWHPKQAASPSTSVGAASSPRAPSSAAAAASGTKGSCAKCGRRLGPTGGPPKSLEAWLDAKPTYCGRCDKHLCLVCAFEASRELGLSHHACPFCSAKVPD